MFKHALLALVALSSSLFGGNLYYQHAKNAVLVNNTKGEYLLTMVGLDNEMLKMSGGLANIEKLTAEQFYDHFGAATPKAVIINLAKKKNLTFKLKKPKYNLVKKSVEYSVEPLSPVEVSDLTSNWGDIVILTEEG